VRCSFLEIYAECISDLLAPAASDASTSAPLKLGYDRLQHGAFVKGLSSTSVQNGMGMARMLCASMWATCRGEEQRRWYCKAPYAAGKRHMTTHGASGLEALVGNEQCTRCATYHNSCRSSSISCQ